MKLTVIFACLIFVLNSAVSLIPPKFQWKLIDYAWEGDFKNKALATEAYIPENNMPTGLARWRDKLFITVPRWKKGVPSSLNFVYLNGSQSEPLRPYPSWQDAFVMDDACCISNNATVVSTFRVHVDQCDRLWVVDNGVSDMAQEVRQVSEPAVVIFDLNTDQLLHRYQFGADVLKDSSVLSSIVVDVASKDCSDAYAYITDMGSNALVVYSLAADDAWRVENHYFHSDPQAGVYKVGGVDFNWSDGVSAAALSNADRDGYRELYLHPTSSTKQFKMSTKLLRDKDVPAEDLFSGVEVVGDKGPLSQASACDFDPKHNILFYTQLCKNAIGCWNSEKPFTEENLSILVKDCNVLEFPNDIKVDQESNLWVLSDRQSRFLYDSMDFSQANFRVLTAPVATLIQGTPCEKNKKSDKKSDKQSEKKSEKNSEKKSEKNLEKNSKKNLEKNSKKNSDEKSCLAKAFSSLSFKKSSKTKTQEEKSSKTKVGGKELKNKGSKEKDSKTKELEAKSSKNKK